MRVGSLRGLCEARWSAAMDILVEDGGLFEVDVAVIRVRGLFRGDLNGH